MPRLMVTVAGITDTACSFDVVGLTVVVVDILVSESVMVAGGGGDGGGCCDVRRGWSVMVMEVASALNVNCIRARNTNTKHLLSVTG